MNLLNALIVRAFFKTAPGLSPGQTPDNLDDFLAEMDSQTRSLRARRNSLKYVRIATTTDGQGQ